MAKKKEQKNKQRSTKHTHKDRVTLKTRGELRCSGRVGSNHDEIIVYKGKQLQTVIIFKGQL